MKLNHPFIQQSLGLLGAVVLRRLTATLDYRVVYHDPRVDPVHPACRHHAIFLLWHEYLLFSLCLRNRGMTALSSQHGDAAVISLMAKHLGYDMVRGSSTRGGVGALRKMMASRKHLTLTPDGPKGPRRHLTEGPIFLASKLKMPIVCLGYAFSDPWRMHSWDRFAIPKPYARGRAVIGAAIPIPERLGREGLEHYRQEVEGQMHRLTDEAEAWASSGKRKSGEMALLPNELAPTLLRKSMSVDENVARPPYAAARSA